MSADADADHPEGELTIRVMAMPRDTNGLGDIFGGWLMSHADMAGSVVAYRRAAGKVVTVAVDDFQFLKPVYVGDVVSFYSRVVHVGRTSLRAAIDILVERRGPEPSDQLRVASARITYVHVGDDRQPSPVPAGPGSHRQS